MWGHAAAVHVQSSVDRVEVAVYGCRVPVDAYEAASLLLVGGKVASATAALIHPHTGIGTNYTRTVMSLQGHGNSCMLARATVIIIWHWAICAIGLVGGDIEGLAPVEVDR